MMERNLLKRSNHPMLWLPPLDSFHGLTISLYNTLHIRETIQSHDAPLGGCIFLINGIEGERWMDGIRSRVFMAVFALAITTDRFYNARPCGSNIFQRASLL